MHGDDAMDVTDVFLQKHPLDGENNTGSTRER